MEIVRQTSSRISSLLTPAIDFISQSPMNVISPVLTAASKINDYNMMLKDLKYAKTFLTSFERLYTRIDNIQNTPIGHVSICNLGNSKEFIDDFKKLIEYYEPTKINTTLQLFSPEWYRAQLRSYVSYGFALMYGMNTQLIEIQKVTSSINLSDKNKKQILQKLRTDMGCIK